MSLIAIGMNLLLAALLIAALGLGLRLNSRLKALRESHEGFARAVADLDAAAARAEQGLADLRAATDEAADVLADRIEKARSLSTKLERQVNEAPAVSRAEPAAPRHRLREEPRDDLILGEDVERVTHKLGSLLSAAREPRPARNKAPSRLARNEAPRQRPQFEDELFGAPEPRMAGGRR
jgi:hypothetical protein